MNEQTLKNQIYYAGYAAQYHALMVHITPLVEGIAVTSIQDPVTAAEVSDLQQYRLHLTEDFDSVEHVLKDPKPSKTRKRITQVMERLRDAEEDTVELIIKLNQRISDVEDPFEGALTARVEARKLADMLVPFIRNLPTNVSESEQGRELISRTLFHIHEMDTPEYREDMSSILVGLYTTLKRLARQHEAQPTANH